MLASLVARSSLSIKPLFPQGSDHWDECMYASPLAVESRGRRFVLIAAGATIAALDPDTGRTAWKVELASPTNQVAWIVATPVIVNDKLVVAFQRRRQRDRARVSHHVAVLDLETRKLDAGFAELELQASAPSFDGDEQIDFLPRNAVSRSALVHVDVPDREQGLVYVAFGNPQDIAPWHGWVFELDLDRWLEQGPAQAVSGVLLTSPEVDCGKAGVSDSRVMLCGAGVWSPAGPKIYPTADGYELLIPTGNGLLNLNRRDYSHSLMRVSRGLHFEPECDPEACEEFNSIAPALECLESCENLFVPRLMSLDAALSPETGSCEGKTFFECYASLDWDLGANSPARVELEHAGALYVMPGKDGAAYLVDAAHMGTLYDRKQIVEPCGTKDSVCKFDWAGMMVTEPTITKLGGSPVALLPTFMFDHAHPAGVVALRIDDAESAPRFTRLWQAPDFADPLAKALFREHPSRLALQELGGETYAWIVDVDRGARGALLAIRVKDGAIRGAVPLLGHGQRYIKPLVIDNRVYISSCEGLHGPSDLEGFEIVSRVQ
jgi:hypothetical protein